MGISSAGYIGGKLARKAGATISSVSAKMVGETLQLGLAGNGLSQNATFKIDDKLVPMVQIWGDPADVAKKDDKLFAGRDNFSW